VEKLWNQIPGLLDLLDLLNREAELLMTGAPTSPV
jgi:hypothetical protein